MQSLKQTLDKLISHFRDRLNCAELCLRCTIMTYNVFWPRMPSNKISVIKIDSYISTLRQWNLIIKCMARFNIFIYCLKSINKQVSIS